MSEQIFISYRRVGGDVTAKLICETLKGKGYTVFFDFDSIRNGRFDTRIFTAIENCDDFILVLSECALDNCVNQDDWVRWEIRHALGKGKNIIPIMLGNFSFPDNLPSDIAAVSKIQGIKFVMDYFDGVISAITSRLLSIPSIPVEEEKAEPQPETDSFKGIFASLFGIGNKKPAPQPAPEPKPQSKPEDMGSSGLTFEQFGEGYIVTGLGYCRDMYVVIPKFYRNLPVIGVGKLHSYSSQTVYGRSVKRIKVPNTVTEICQNAFYGLTDLESVTIPSSVNKISSNSFMRGTYPVAEIVYEGTMEMWNNIRFAPDWIKLNYGSTVVVCSDGVIELKKINKFGLSI